MNSLTERDRIEQFSKLMDSYVPEDFKKWLIENRFFTTPASIHYHGVYSGGLFDHSFAVTKTLLSFTERLELSWMKERSPYIVGMFHDLCKLDNYTTKKTRRIKMKKVVATIMICLITVLLLTGCTENKPVNVNVKNDTSIDGTVFGESALIEIGDGLWYDATTRIVYWWNGYFNRPYREYATTPSPYYAPNGLPYRYNPETNTFEEIYE